jgi:hypothetical protein
MRLDGRLVAYTKQVNNYSRQGQTFCRVGYQHKQLFLKPRQQKIQELTYSNTGMGRRKIWIRLTTE